MNAETVPVVTPRRATSSWTRAPCSSTSARPTSGRPATRRRRSGSRWASSRTAVGELPRDRAHRRHLPLREPVARRRRRADAARLRRGEPRRRHARLGRRGLRRRGRRRSARRRHLAAASVRTRSSANPYPRRGDNGPHGAAEAQRAGHRSPRPGVSVAVAGVLAGFMAAGDHPPTPRRRRRALVVGRPRRRARRSTRRRRRAAVTAVPRTVGERHERLAVPAPAADPDRRQLGWPPTSGGTWLAPAGWSRGVSWWPRAPGASCTRSARSAVDRRRRGCSPSTAT